LFTLLLPKHATSNLHWYNSAGEIDEIAAMQYGSILLLESSLGRKSGHGGTNPRKSMLSRLLAKVLLMACRGYLFTFLLPNHSATNVYWYYSAGEIYKITALHYGSILLLEKRPGSEIRAWWCHTEEINDIFAFSEGFANGLRGLLVHFPAS